MLASVFMTSAPREAWGDLATTAFVEASVLFKAFDPEARRDLLQLARVVDFAQGEIVSLPADETFLLLLEGSGAVHANVPAGPVELYRLERGAYYGVGRALALPRETWLTAVSDVSVVVFPAPVVAAMVERCPKAKKLLEAVRTARLREEASRLAS
jgi:CRP-like cAMP-binding protein